MQVRTEKPAASPALTANERCPSLRMMSEHCFSVGSSPRRAMYFPPHIGGLEVVADSEMRALMQRRHGAQ